MFLQSSRLTLAKREVGSSCLWLCQETIRQQQNVFKFMPWMCTEWCTCTRGACGSVWATAVEEIALGDLLRWIYKIGQNTHLACRTIPPEIKIFISLEKEEEKYKLVSWNVRPNKISPADGSPTTRMKSTCRSVGISFRYINMLNIRPRLKSPLILIVLMNTYHWRTCFNHEDRNRLCNWGGSS